MMNCIPWACNPAKEVKHIKHMNQIFLPVKKQKNTPLYLFTFASNMSQSVWVWIHILLKYVALTLRLICMLQTLAGIAGLTRFSGIHVQRKHGRSPGNRIWCNKVVWAVGAFQGRWRHQVEFYFYIFGSASFRNRLLLRQIQEFILTHYGSGV